MTEQELRDAILKSAQDVETPEQIMPEVVLQELEGRKRPGTSTGEQQAGRSWRALLGRAAKPLAGAAAVLALALGITAVARLGQPAGIGSGQKTGQTESGAGQEAGQAEAINESGNDGVQMADTGNDGAQMADTGNGSAGPKQDAGDMFTVAGSYEQVYALLEESEEYYFNKEYAVDDALNSSAILEEEPTQGTSAVAGPMEDSQNGAGSSNLQGYSRTNVQEAGVDESDIIKTDGNYIYTVRQDGIEITDISGEAMSRAARIPLEDPGARVMEMYVQGDVLNLILQHENTELEQEDIDRKREAQDVFFMDSHSTTHLVTYDISDRKKPVLVGEVSQDGVYYTSRKMGSVVYLFTTEYELTEIPRIAGETVACDCIYLPQRGRQGLLVSSVDVKQPEKVLDHVMVVNDYVDIYVSTGAMYLYRNSWQDAGDTTQIAKFSLEKGTIEAVGSVSVKGQIRDTFAINEGSGSLRVLTTDWSGEREENNLYVLDEELKLVGSLTGLAPGEEIYAARFLKNMAYFVTYRNTDPLFAVDLSDPANPKVLSELKITGFSEYLHFWGEDKLLGIGYETDPDTGRTEGLKLAMFDITDPTALSVLDSVVLKGLDYSPALYEYKTVLADYGANLFGFVGVEYQDPGKRVSYYLYQWGEDGFERLLEEEVEGGMRDNGYRGLYSGARFYLAGPDGVSAYDRERGYEKLESLSY